MQLLIDSDAFCKLGSCGLLQEVIENLGSSFSECRILPALPHMLKKGSLRRKYGPEISDVLILLAKRIPFLTQPTEDLLNQLIQINDIDPGEALIFAAAMEQEVYILTADKRALTALKDIPPFPDGLSGRILLLESVLLDLCHRLGPEEIRKRVQVLIPFDIMVSICFSPGVSDPVQALKSYNSDTVLKLTPLVLWTSE